MSWQYGYCHERYARRERGSGRVQFVIWPKGYFVPGDVYDKQGKHYPNGYTYPEDFWVDFSSSWWPGFRPYPGLSWWRRLKQWRAVVVEEALSSDHRPSLLKMLRALWTGQVERARWRARIRTCRKCPIFDGELKRCRGPVIHQRVWMPTWFDHKLQTFGMWTKKIMPAPGCGCYVPFLALTKKPYVGEKGSGCWGRATMGGSFGWD